jgi:hypothetical protein
VTTPVVFKMCTELNIYNLIYVNKISYFKKGIITFPEMKAEVNYTSDTTLHWKTTDPKGEVLEGDEAISYKKLTDHLHFLNWIEKVGWTVSQIINTKDGEVKAYWSFKDEKSAREKRSSQFVDATFGYAK